MRDFVIAAYSDSEIPYWFADENDVPVFLMPYTLDGKEELFDLGRNTDFKAFYDALRNGSEATTSTRSPIDIEEFFEGIIKDHKDVLYLSFSSKLSAHYELSLGARERVLEKYPDANITIVDTLSIAMGAGMLVYNAVKQKKEGRSMEEIADWVEKNKRRSLHFFSVDSLMYLKKTGRLSGITATMGTILDLKPILNLTKEGKIVAFDKVKGRKKVVKYLADMIQQNQDNTPESHDMAVVCHGDNPEMAQMLKEEIEKRFDFKDIWYMDVGPVIGCHAGPGVLGLLFMGKERTN